MTKRQFDFENQYQVLKQKVEDLMEESRIHNIDLSEEIALLENKMARIRESKYKNLSPWERVLLSRSPERPGAEDYIGYLCSEWIELHGDRLFGDDQAIIAGLGMFHGMPLTIVGHRKGKTTSQKLQYNFGMPHPEGFRKVIRILRQAEKFRRPILSFVDTSGAFPGVGAEERGQASAIAETLMAMVSVKVPVISVVSGEGGSGGALALAVGDRIVMLSNSVFSVASPETCSSILFKDAARVEDMAEASKLTAADLLGMNLIDEIIEEPVGGANQDFENTARLVEVSILKHLRDLSDKEPDILVKERFEKYRRIGKIIPT